MKVKPNKLHLRIGLVFLPFLLLSTLTGFFRANHQWFWKENYMKKKRDLYESTLSLPAVSPEDCFRRCGEFYGKKVEIQQLRLKQDGGNLWYELKVKKERPLLMDAVNGKTYPVIGDSLALLLASQYTASDLSPDTCLLLDDYVHRKQKETRPVYLIRYKDDLHTEIYLDKYTGEIVEELDDNLRFGVWMVKLHDYDFWGSKRFNLSFVAVGILAVGFTGFYLWIRTRRKKAKMNK